MPPGVTLERNGVNNAVQWRLAGGFSCRGLLARIVLYGLDDVCESTQRREFFRRSRTGNALQHFVVVSAMRQSEPFKTRADGIEPRVHGRRIGSGLCRPETLRNGGVARPDAGVYIFGVHVFRPHAGFAAKDQLLLVVGEVCGRSTHGIDGVVTSGAPAEIEIVAV